MHHEQLNSKVIVPFYSETKEISSYHFLQGTSHKNSIIVRYAKKSITLWIGLTLSDVPLHYSLAVESEVAM